MAQVTIEGSVLLPNGSGPKTGRIIATLSSNASDASGNRVVGRTVFHVPDGGDLATGGRAFILEANDGLTPSGTYYTVEYVLLDASGAVHALVELWDVTGSGTQNIGDITIIGMGGSLYSPNDEDAYHKSIGSEISATTEKTTLADGDVLLIEDSAASYVKKRVRVDNLPGGAWTVYTTGTKPSPPAAGNAYVPYIVKDPGEHAVGEIIYQKDDDTYDYFPIFSPF